MGKRWTDNEMNAAELFHTCTRKGMDSTASSILWNAIHLMEPDTWYDFIQKLTKHVEEGGHITREFCLEAMGFGEATKNLCRIAFKMLDNGEYEELNRWMTDYGGFRLKDWDHESR